jgi:ATP-binding cassette subfamily G (WHITE) protein 2 (PDR)
MEDETNSKGDKMQEMLPNSPKASAPEGGQFSSSQSASLVTSKSPYAGNSSKVMVTTTRQDILSSIDERATSNDSELGSRLESLSSNLAQIPLPDVTDPEFDVRTWATAVLQNAPKENIKFRQASFVFKGLDVTGSASTANIQPTVASIFVAPLTLARSLIRGRAPEKKILSGFDGVTKPGELLLVLGRPGSGCSTLLRTIAGEQGGLKTCPESAINYNGWSHGFFRLSRD